MDLEKKDDWFLMHGCITHFYWTSSNEDLLNKIGKMRSMRNYLGQHGANSPVVRMVIAEVGTVSEQGNDDENSEVCVFAIDDEVFIGRFCGSHKLANGDQVKVVASPSKPGVSVARAIQRSADELIWLPRLVFRGDSAALSASWRSVRRSSYFGIGVLLLLTLGDSWIRGPSLTIDQILMYVSAFGLAVPTVSMIGEFLPTRVGKEHAETGTKIFAVLGFPNPASIDLEYARLDFHGDEINVNDVYMYGLTIDARGIGKNSA
jgi:hypothetical protein